MLLITLCEKTNNLGKYDIIYYNSIYCIYYNCIIYIVYIIIIICNWTFFMQEKTFNTAATGIIPCCCNIERFFLHKKYPKISKHEASPLTHPISFITKLEKISCFQIAPEMKIMGNILYQPNCYSNLSKWKRGQTWKRCNEATREHEQEGLALWKVRERISRNRCVCAYLLTVSCSYTILYTILTVVFIWNSRAVVRIMCDHQQEHNYCKLCQGGTFNVDFGRGWVW